MAGRNRGWRWQRRRQGLEVIVVCPDETCVNCATEAILLKDELERTTDNPVLVMRMEHEH